MRIVIVGGGIVGLATAWQLQRTAPEIEVTVLEKEWELARHQTAHNSGVVHAGIYYRPGSLKARLCRRGIGLLRDFCRQRGLPYEQCGKLVIATDEAERGRLQALAETAAANGVPGLRWLEANEIRSFEPCAQGVAALHSPETAITDFRQVALALASEVQAAGGEVRVGSQAVRVESAARVVLAGRASPLEADRVIVCAGLWADRLARASGEPSDPRIVPFRGEYWQLRPGREASVRGLIYPVPDPGLPFLGVHLTRTIDGGVLVGPNAVLALARDGYERRRIVARDLVDTVAWPGTARMMRRHWRAGVDELARSISRRRFIEDARRYLPGLQADDVVRAPAGVRAQAVDRDGALVDDFRLSVGRNVIWVRNAPSPAATSSLAIAEELVERALA